MECKYVLGKAKCGVACGILHTDGHDMVFYVERRTAGSGNWFTRRCYVALKRAEQMHAEALKWAEQTHAEAL